MYICKFYVMVFLARAGAMQAPGVEKGDLSHFSGAPSAQ